MRQGKRVAGPHEDITYKIIGAAMALHGRLGPGYPEEIYQRGLAADLEAAGLGFEEQKKVEVWDGDTLLGFYFLDYLVEGLVIVELKALGWLRDEHRAQVISYLAMTGLPIGLLIDFGRRSLDFRRIFPPPDPEIHRVNHQWLFVPDWLKEGRERPK
jgi:GxxExxY protein